MRKNPDLSENQQAKTLECERDLTRAKDIEVVVRRGRDTVRREHKEGHRRGKKGLAADDPLAGLEGFDPAAGGSSVTDGDDPLAGLDGFGKQSHTRAPRSSNDKAPPKAKGIHRYIYERAGLTHEQALQFARAKLKEATLHERAIHVSMRGELDLDPRRMVTLTGHGSSWDQDYYVTEITRTLGMGGFQMSLTGKNESPGGVTIVTSSGTTG